MSEIAVKIDHVSKYFRLPTESSTSLRTTLINRLNGVKGYKEQHVLKDVSFEVEKGDFFGIVGRNGSGKSTLLKIISQIYTPEKGHVTVNGKLVSFIELGVGFNPELTGRENVFLNGAMLGFSPEEIGEMYDEIVAFAELSEFMNQKLKNYSSGMQVRLAFSVAIKAKGDILVLDEVLAVGDEAFQRKCNEFFVETKKDKSKTVILVTHDMSAVQRYCNKAVYISDGYAAENTDVQHVTNLYSADNLKVSQHTEHDALSDRVWITTDSETLLTKTTDKLPFTIHFEANTAPTKAEEKLYLSYFLYDATRGGAAYESPAQVVKIGETLSAEIPMANFHNTEFQLGATLRKDPSDWENDNPLSQTEVITVTQPGEDIRFIYRNPDDREAASLLKTL
ncbi:ATP-binding cassette domain-containing protein [Lactococcus raffinolactis]|jgi:ABC-2 type transport system ATP-binding protein|uniref:ABC transporter ATP-binding protein n=1 Tax=Pseudolactococcus raffinolactis TaxID=1366 RepID=UPI0014368AEE|nr:ABC transporter ATP-binding protein [Lactococcus raffinolactis]QIW59793.1 ATP-binding cassette domain-containing protein [Lactococcus raffinolactis]